MPRLTLILLLLLAACVAGGGVIAARRVVDARVERDRTAHRDLILSLNAETRQLEGLYEAHLRSAGTRLSSAWSDRAEMQRSIAEEVEGIQRVSWLYWKNSGRESHLSIGFPPNPPLAEPTLAKEHDGLPRPRVLLDARTLFPNVSGHQHGWIDEPGKPLMFHIQSGVVAVLLTIDRAAVQEAMTNQMRQNKRMQQLLTGPDLLRQENGTILHRAGTLPESPPDVLMSISSRFGGWQLASWDARESRVTYDTPILAAGMALGVLTALGGLALHAQQRRAAKLAAQRVSFVNRVSHELRTPMTNILLNLDVIEESMPEASAGRFGLIREEAGRLSRLIENVLTFSRKEEGRLKLQNGPCRPAEVVEKVLRQFEPALARRGISLTHTHEGTRDEIVLDADALAQITANLLSNVEKYAPEAPASIQTTQSELEFTLRVSDGGPGIAEKDAERVFEPFERLDDRVAAGVSGAGLGLSIARELARRMGGELKLVTMEKGACFVFNLPLPPPLTPTPGSVGQKTFATGGGVGVRGGEG